MLKNWDWPEVSIIGADRKDRGPYERESFKPMFRKDKQFWSVKYLRQIKFKLISNKKRGKNVQIQSYGFFFLALIDTRLSMILQKKTAIQQVCLSLVPRVAFPF